MSVFPDCRQLLTVTPDQAARWLATIGPGYRPYNPAMVERLAQAMNDGRWAPTPTDPIRIDVTGRMRGGRIRLLAVQRHGEPVQMWVETSPPLQPPETAPAAYVDIDPLDGTPLGRTHLEAMRYDGGNTDVVRAWVMQQQPGRVTDVTDVTDDGGGGLRLAEPGRAAGELWAYPGDWVGRMLGGGYLVMPYPVFARVFAPMPTALGGGQLLLVTPEQAIAWLDTVGPGHRPPAPYVSQRLATIMGGKKYRPEPLRPVRIDATGRLREGVHKLAAVIRHGKPVALYVDISPPAQPEQLEPTWWTGTGSDLRVQAIRYDGHNTDDVRAWLAATSGGQATADDDGALALHIETGQNEPIPVYPGDWIAYSQLPSRGVTVSMSHNMFTQAFRKDEGHG